MGCGICILMILCKWRENNTTYSVFSAKGLKVDTIQVEHRSKRTKTPRINSLGGEPHAAAAELVVSRFFLLDGGDIGSTTSVISSSYDNSAVSIVVSTCLLGPLRFEAGVRDPSPSSGGMSERGGYCERGCCCCCCP